MVNIIPIELVVEDVPSELIVRKLIHSSRRPYRIGTCYKEGKTELKKKITGYNNAAQGSPYLVLADLDNCECPSAIIGHWLPHGSNRNLIFRVAVREIESWIMADSDSFCRYLSLKSNRIPEDTDTIADPKEYLVNLARKCRKSRIKNAIVPAKGSTAKVGKDYNGALAEFILSHWSLENALTHSPSLARTFEALKNFHWN